MSVRSRAIDAHFRRFTLTHARVHGVKSMLRMRANSARMAAKTAEVGGNTHLAASLRGKAQAFGEAIRLLDAVAADRRIPKRRQDRVATMPEEELTR